MKFCEECGAKLDDSSTFCEECGTQVAPVPSQVIKTTSPNITDKVDKVSKSKYILIGIILALVVIIVILVVLLTNKSNQNDTTDLSSNAQTISDVEDKTDRETEIITEAESSTEVETITESISLTSLYDDLQNTKWYTKDYVSPHYQLEFKSFGEGNDSIIFDLYLYDNVNYEISGKIPGIEGKLTESAIEFDISPKNGFDFYGYDYLSESYVATSYLQYARGSFTYDDGELKISKIALDAYFNIDTTNIPLIKEGEANQTSQTKLTIEWLSNTRWQSVDLTDTITPRYSVKFKNLSTGYDISGNAYDCVLFDLYMCVDTGNGEERLWIPDVKGKMQGNKLVFYVGTQSDFNHLYRYNRQTGDYNICYEGSPYGSGSFELVDGGFYISSIDMFAYVDIKESNVELISSY